MPNSEKRQIVIVGAGPAGLTSALECQRLGHQVTVIEKDEEYVGGISRTVNYRGYRFDIGGHRFFSKNTEITQWWDERLPEDFIDVNRLSRIYFDKRFFNYPLNATNVVRNLGPIDSLALLTSYLKSCLQPIRPEVSFADWVTNRFGRKLYNTFFKSYTEKVWGIRGEEISADWAAQRIKSLSFKSAIRDACRSGFNLTGKREHVKSLIKSFKYPRRGPGMMWEKSRDDFISAGGKLFMGQSVTGFERSGNRIEKVYAQNAQGERFQYSVDGCIVSMPMCECIQAINPDLGSDVVHAAKQLRYRDFITVALVLKKKNLFPDNWIYIHEPHVKVGRIQNFKNWSPEMIPDPNYTCLGMEYFCFEGDGLWSRPDNDLIDLASEELETLGLGDRRDLMDATLVRTEKAYPVYDHDYQTHVSTIREGLKGLENFQVVGRNGMHKYNNQDHSMLTGMFAARNISGASYDVWRVNTDAEYHEMPSCNGTGDSGPEFSSLTVPSSVNNG